ncbi:MAG: glycosyltransferase family 2 protein [Magnetococcales bacterium]|nr:glycosyltransferase family 2 protein [Magnetococcales bacterium]MBF0438325.1 glycosyltransferase family 2 protein [Magnetococcales bacterium]
MPEISIIIRTRNEERWIRHCLQGVFEQDFKDFEVILVDNQSDDHTVEVAQRFPLTHVVTIEDYLPGRALNLGIEKACGAFIVCLSAHCVPHDNQWLSALRRNFTDPQVAGVYGRQIPVAFSDDVDKRDLMIVFGLDRRVQIKDTFFHNANSMLRRSLWEITPFDATVTNIEDRVWGKAMIEAGYQLIYEPDAMVYHHHGLHQGNDARRARGVISIIEKVEGAKVLQGLPNSMRPEQCHVVAVLPVLGEVQTLAGRNLLTDLIRGLQTAKYVKTIYVCSENPQAAQIAQTCGVRFIARPEALISPDKTIEDVLQFALEAIEAGGEFPDSLLYANYLYPFRPPSLWDELVQDAQFKGLDTIFPSYPDYSNTWWRQGGDRFTQVGEGLLPRIRKEPLYRALYGLGCLTGVPIIRTKKLIGGRIGILPVEELLYTLRYTERSATILDVLERHFQGGVGT